MTKLIRVDKVAEILGVSKATIYRWIKENPDFPRPVKLGKQTTAYITSEIEAFIKTNQQATA